MKRIFIVWLLISFYECIAVAEERLDLLSLCTNKGYVVTFQSFSNLVVVNNSSIIRFQNDSRAMVFNGVLIWLNSTASYIDGQWTMAKADAELILEPLLNPESVTTVSEYSRIMIDPGHGGEDSGAKSEDGLYEKDIVLAMSKDIADILKIEHHEVLLTRSNDIPLTTTDRVRKSKEERADLYVSIHLNSAPSINASGLETFVVAGKGFPSSLDLNGNSNMDLVPGNKNDVKNILLAYSIHSYLLNLLKCPDRGIKHARFEVIKNVNCPAVLVECGFITNTNDVKNLKDEEYLKLVSVGIAGGILKYKSMVKIVPSPPAMLSNEYVDSDKKTNSASVMLSSVEIISESTTSSTARASSNIQLTATNSSVSVKTNIENALSHTNPGVQVITLPTNGVIDVGPIEHKEYDGKDLEIKASPAGGKTIIKDNMMDETKKELDMQTQRLKP